MTNTGCQMEFRRSVFHSSFGFSHSLVIRGLMLAIRAYQLTISPAQSFLFGATGGCRYTPSCSTYATEALQEHGASAGLALAAKRICRCHPWGGCGHDPVPRTRGNGLKSTSEAGR